MKSAAKYIDLDDALPPATRPASHARPEQAHPSHVPPQLYAPPADNMVAALEDYDSGVREAAAGALGGIKD